MMTQMIDRLELVLNRNWQPVNVATVARVLTMLCNETALVVDPVTFQTNDWNDWSKLWIQLSCRATICEVAKAAGHTPV